MAFGDLSRWTKALDDRVTAMWLAGNTSSEIAAALGPDFTKNMVIGRVHRLKLPARRSPVVRRAETPELHEAARVRREADAVLARRRDFATVAGGGAPEGGGSEAIRGDTLVALGVVAAVPAAPVRAVAPAVVLALPGVSRPCCWPMWGDVERPDHRYCEAPGVPGRSYCAEHHARGYTTPLQRSEAAIAADEARRMAALGRVARGEVRVPSPWGGA